MSRRDLVVILTAHEMKVVFVSDELRLHYAVSERFESPGLFSQEYSVFTDIVEDIEEQVGIRMLDGNGMLVVGGKEQEGVRNFHLVFLPEYFQTAFIVALSELSLWKAEQLLSSLPLTPVYTSHLMDLNAEEMIDSSNLLSPDVTILTGGEDNSEVFGLVTLADYLSLTESDKTENTLFYIGSPATKDEVFRRLSPKFSLSHFTFAERHKVRQKVAEMAARRLQVQLPEFSPLLSAKKPMLISDVIEWSAWLVSQFYGENSLVVYYASSFVVCGVAWREKGEWLTDVRTSEYRAFSLSKESESVAVLLQSECYDMQQLSEHRDELLTLATRNIDMLFSPESSENHLFNSTHPYLFARTEFSEKRAYNCSRFVYGGELIAPLKDTVEFLNNLSNLTMLSSFVHLYSDSEQRLFTFATMDRGDSEQAKAAIEQNMMPPLSFQGYVVRPDEMEILSRVEAILVITGGDIDGKTTKQLTTGYRHIFLLQPGQRAVIEVNGGTLGGKTNHHFVCDNQEFQIYIDLRAIQ